ncbi:MAG: amidohydrolase [Candidatus Calescibacterium sp.]|nr:amidohydrolase [Candidatus Calescibacterium sp.]MDW8195577.1 amidohydrolase [Candidatus Calescibacterium sp.]
MIEELIFHRRNLHRIPELGFQEYKTQQYIIDNISSFVDRYQVMAKTGVVGFLNNGARKTIIIRADMDGLPIQEDNQVEYRSIHDGLMHACGHDSHMAILISLVKYFYLHRENLKVNLKYMFQPAEEGLGGAKLMIEEGVLENVDFALAIHVWNELEYGKIGIGKGPVMASADWFEIEIIGKGAHAATPDLAIDPILTASLFINQVYNIFPRIFKEYILSFTYIEAGTSTNIIPENCILKGTVRNFNEDTRKKIAIYLEQNLKDICRSVGAKYVFKYEFGYPVLVNNEWLYNIGVEVATKLVGRENITDFRSYGAEDMAFVLQKVPGLYVAIGSGKGNPHHSPKFDINEQSMLIGFEFLKNMVLEIQERI